MIFRGSKTGLPLLNGNHHMEGPVCPCHTAILSRNSFCDCLVEVVYLDLYTLQLFLDT